MDSRLKWVKELLNFNDDQEVRVTPVAFEEGALRGMRVGGNGRGRYPSGVCQAGGGAIVE